MPLTAKSKDMDMTTMTTMKRTASASPWRSLGVVGVAMIVALAIWTVAHLLGGVDLTVGKGQDPSQVGAVDVLVAAALAGLAAWGVRALLTRRGIDRWWPFTGSTALAISMTGPSYLADGLASVVLMVMHLAVGAVLIAGHAKAMAPRR